MRSLQSVLRPIDVVDVAPTIAKYLWRVDIPVHSVGIAQNYFLPSLADGGSNVAYANALKQNIVS